MEHTKDLEKRVFKMKCDICGHVYDYSEKVIYHITAKINGVLKPHTHICKDCYEKLEIKTPEITIDNIAENNC